MASAARHGRSGAPLRSRLANAHCRAFGWVVVGPFAASPSLRGHPSLPCCQGAHDVFPIGHARIATFTCLALFRRCGGPTPARSPTRAPYGTRWFAREPRSLSGRAPLSFHGSGNPTRSNKPRLLRRHPSGFRALRGGPLPAVQRRSGGFLQCGGGVARWRRRWCRAGVWCGGARGWCWRQRSWVSGGGWGTLVGHCVGGWRRSVGGGVRAWWRSGSAVAGRVEARLGCVRRLVPGALVPLGPAAFPRTGQAGSPSGDPVVPFLRFVMPGQGVVLGRVRSLPAVRLGDVPPLSLRSREGTRTERTLPISAS